MGLFFRGKKEVVQEDRTLLLYRKTLLEDPNLILRTAYEEKTYPTRLIDWTGQCIVFAAPIVSNSHIIYLTGNCVDITFVSKQGLFQTRVKITDNFTQGEILVYNSIMIEPLIKNQQRKHFRLDIVLDISFKIIPPDKTNYDLAKIEAIKGLCANISMGGMCLHSKKLIDVGQTIVLEFVFDEVPFTLSGEVLYNEEDIVNRYFVHRIQFCSIDVVDSNRLNQLIFEHQRNILRQLK